MPEDKQILCFDQDSGLMDDKEGERFFNDDGEVTETVKKIMEFLQQVQRDRLYTESVCKLLHNKKLIQPWFITLKTEGQEVPIKGLFRIDEQALNALDKDDFEEIRQAGALLLIYCQLLSMQHLQALAQLASNQEKQKTPEIPDISKLFGEDDGEQLFKF